jgi:membrane-associated phospholipid phosphatase
MRGKRASEGLAASRRMLDDMTERFGAELMIFLRAGARPPYGMNTPTRAILGLALLLGLSRAAWAASVPWTPSASARHALEVLVDDGGLALTTSQWPLPRDAVVHALDAMPSPLTPALEDARALVMSELRDQQSARTGLIVRKEADALSGFGDDSTPGSSLQLRSGVLEGPHLAMQVGGRLDPVADTGADQATARLDESAVAVDAFGLQVQAWAHRTWWGPGWQSALPLSNNAPPFDGIGLQRAEVVPSESPWLSWLGPWNVDFFLAETVGESLGKGSNPLLTGLRLTARPFSHLELGFTRMAQFGGEGHQESMGSFLRAMVGSHANAQTVAAQSRDSGNGLAGYDIRVRCPDGVRCAFYGQFIGEDSRKHLPYKFLNLLGTELWSADDGNRLYIEGMETGCRVTWKGEPQPNCAYRNYAYPGGYTNGFRWIGASAGADARMVTLGWVNSEWDSSIRLDYGLVGSSFGTWTQVHDEAGSAGRLWALSARRGWHFGAATVTPEFDWTRVSTSEGMRVESRVGVEMSLILDDLGPAAPDRFADALAGASSTTTSRLLASTALIGGAALFDRAADSYARQHAGEPALKVMEYVGNGLPFIEFGLAGAGWLAWRGTSDGNLALASVQSGLTSVAIAEAIKVAVDRSRPTEERGPTDFGHEKRTDSSFPSVHTALAWGVLTPIAQRYDAPWLYGVAALTNVGRVASRDHWLSDTVASSVLGYLVGDWFGRRADTGSSTVMVMPHGVAMTMKFQ